MARKPIKRDKLVEKYLAIYESMTKDQPDMACAILATAFLENSLMTLLDDFLVQDKEITPVMFKHNRPLGGFANCRDMAFCLGFLTKEMYENLVLIGDIRNRFGHGHELLSFDNDVKPSDQEKSIKVMCDKLRFPFYIGYVFDGKPMIGEPPRKISARERFTNVSALLFKRLLMMHDVRRCSKRIEW